MGRCRITVGIRRRTDYDLCGDARGGGIRVGHGAAAAWGAAESSYGNLPWGWAHMWAVSAPMRTVYPLRVLSTNLISNHDVWASGVSKGAL